MKSLILNKWFWISVGIALFFSTVSKPNPPLDFIPTVISVLLTGMFSTITIMLSLILNKDLINLESSFKKNIEESLPLIRLHLLMFICLLTLSVVASYWPDLLLNLLPHIIVRFISTNNISVFTNIFSMTLAIISTVEMINTVFALFEVRWILLNHKEESNNHNNNQPQVTKVKLISSMGPNSTTESSSKPHS